MTITTTPMNADQIDRVEKLTAQFPELLKLLPLKVVWLAWRRSSTPIYDFDLPFKGSFGITLNGRLYYRMSYDDSSYRAIEFGGPEMSLDSERFIEILETELAKLKVKVAERADLITRARVALWAAPLWGNMPEFRWMIAWDNSEHRTMRQICTTDNAIIRDESHRGVQFGITRGHELVILEGVFYPGYYTIIDPEGLPDQHLKKIIEVFSIKQRPTLSRDRKRHGRR